MRFRQAKLLAITVAIGACSRGVNVSGNTKPQPTFSTVLVTPGVEVLLAGDMAVLKDMRVGLITNHTGRLKDGRSTIDALYADKRLKLSALFGPEHGIRGDAAPGAKIDTETDTKTGLPIYSLYGQTNKPTPEMLANLDALVFDIQDVGARYYTYEWTMALAMKAAADNHKRFVILDRPNPISGMVQGNTNDTTSFVGLYPVPMRYGLTVGELATFINKQYNIGADLHVIKAAGWQRSAYYDQTNMPWIKPSPNLPDIESAISYPGTCLFEGTNVSVGRGTPNAYAQIGAPWLNTKELIAHLLTYDFPGVRYEAVSVIPINPADNKFKDQSVNFIRFVVTNRRTYDPTNVAIAALVEIHDLHKSDFKLTRGFDRLVGNSRVRTQIEAGTSYRDIVKDWDEQVKTFEDLRKPYLLY